jgi:enamine deaminase RidA (YjgF/YER057c/UK114 family)
LPPQAGRRRPNPEPPHDPRPAPSDFAARLGQAQRLRQGQIGWNPANSTFESDGFVDQARQALANIAALLAAAGATPAHLVRLTWYVVDKHEYLANLAAVGSAYRDVLGRNFPAMTLVEVKSLLETRARVEIEATAVLPD